RQIVLRLAVRIGHEDGTRYAPDAGIWTAADVLASFYITLPVAAQVAAVGELTGDRNPAPPPGGASARPGPRQDRERDRRMRLLERPRDVAHLELGPDGVLERDLPEAAVDPVGRILRPELQDHVDRLEHHLGP